MYWRYGRVKISFLSNDIKWQKRLILIKKAELKQKKKVRTMKICNTCLRTTNEIHKEGLQQKKKEFATYIICGLKQLLLIIARYDKKNLMGNWKWCCFIWRNNLFKFEASIRQNCVTSQKWMEISHCSGKIT